MTVQKHRAEDGDELIRRTTQFWVLSLWKQKDNNSELFL